MARYAAYCGLYCGACICMLTYEKATGAPEAAGVEPEFEESACAGCGSEGLKDCEYVVCNKQHGTESCAFCPEFPCARITAFSQEKWEHHQKVLDNLNRIKEIGIEQWLAEQKEYWSCSSCGTRTVWYQSQCRKCGKEIPGHMVWVS